MTGFGESLRAERERRGQSLADVCTLTKISERQLQAIESEQYAELPPGVFRRGMVRAYITSLELDVDPWMQRFQRSYEEVVGPDAEMTPDRLAEFAENVKRSRNGYGSRNSWRWIGVLLLLLLLCAAGYAAWRFVLQPRLP